MAITLEDIPGFFFAGRRQIWNDGMFRHGITRCLSEIEDAFIEKNGTTLWDPAFRKADILPVIESLYGTNDFSKRLTTAILDVCTSLMEPFMGTVKYGTAIGFSDSVYSDIEYYLKSACDMAGSERSLQAGEQRLIRRFFTGFEEQLEDAADQFIDERITPEVLTLHRSRAKDAETKLIPYNDADSEKLENLATSLLHYINDTLFNAFNASITIDGTYKNIYRVITVLLVDRIRDACPDWRPPDYDSESMGDMYHTDIDILWKKFRELCIINCKPLKNQTYGSFSRSQEDDYEDLLCHLH